MPVLVMLGAVASFFSLSANVPQVTRALRTRSVEGVSWASTVMSLATFTLWCVYAFAIADGVQIVNNTVAFVLLVALAAAMVRAGGARSSWTALVAILASGVVAVLTVDVFNSFVLAMCATTLSSMRMVPQTRLALTGKPLWGLDPWATVLGWVGTLLWLFYGSVDDTAVAICSAIALTMQTTVLAFRLPPRRTLASLAGGRLGPRVARALAPVSARFPERRPADFELAA